ncbi:MAG TPA: MFS transporter [Hyphomicrobiaceae bacterium]|nr:MFS transporter [Hyphomicrobiaceae bacterium]
MISEQQSAPGAAQHRPSAWSPFRHATFAMLWIATVVSNIGSWMHSAASGWLMTVLNPSPLVVSLVQVATTLPIFLFAFPAGALADIVDRRTFLLVAQILMTAVAAVFAAMVWLDAATPFNLLLFTFLIGIGSAMTAPAFQAIVPQLVPKQDLNAAVAANSVGINISRAIGPALAGILVAAIGTSAPFWINALSNLGVIAALFLWQSRQTHAAQLPVERFSGAIRVGVRHAWNNPHLRSTLIRACAFFVFASAYWALLPLVARQQIQGGPALYGYLLGTIGASAVAASLALPWLKTRLDPDRLVAAGAFGTALAMVLYGLAWHPVPAFLASILAGASWIAVLASLNVSAQVALPDWVRARGLAVFVTVFFGALTLGSMIWGQVASLVGLPAAHILAAIGVAAAVPLTWRWKLQTGAAADMTPSMHWPAPIGAGEIEQDRGPVLVAVSYQIRPEEKAAFLDAVTKLGSARRRDGAFHWGIYEDVSQPGRFVETFSLDSWIDHLRQHGRVTNSDRAQQELVNRFQVGERPQVTHLVAS